MVSGKKPEQDLSGSDLPGGSSDTAVLAVPLGGFQPDAGAAAMPAAEDVSGARTALWQRQDQGHSGVERAASATSEVTMVPSGRRGSVAADPIEPGSVIADRYRLDRELGRGGMGQVFLGQNLALELPVAVKVMLPSVASDPVLVRRFEREARAMSALRHKNIVQVLDFGVHAHVPFLVMEFLVGVPLSSRLYARGGSLPMAEIDFVMQDLFDAFELAHDRDIIHRDLKPDNIFMAREPNGQEVAKVLDFGLAHMKDPKDSGPTLTRADMVSGTPEYMSPEQCRSLKVGPSADIYAIGCVLTEMLQGRPPFDGASSVDIMTKQMFYEAPAIQRPPQVDPVPAAVEKLRLALLAKRVGNRPADIATLRQQWNQAMDPNAVEVLVGRKSEAPAGTRDERAPAWSNAEPRHQLSESAGGVVVVRIWTAEQGANQQGVDEACVMGLHAQDIQVQELSPADAPPAELVVVLDTGADIEAARRWLVHRAQLLGGKDVGAGVLVCAQNLGADEMGQLIEAGARDVLAYPISPDTLGRKLRRLLRKAARR